eukprot:COSAG06_NODE_3599_length_5136_cov_24.510621_7_plen_816_part_00
MGGGGSKGGGSGETNGQQTDGGRELASPNGSVSSMHAVVPAWSSGVPPLAVPTVAPRRARRTLQQNTVKVPAPRPDPSGPPGAMATKGGYEKSDVVVMASPAGGPGADPSPKLGQLKGMLQNGLIEQSDYDERKRQLLDGMILEEFDDVLAIADRALAGAAGSLASPASLGAPLSPDAAVGQGVEPSVLLKTSRARLLVKPLDEDLDPWDRQRWWESDVGREERLLKLCAGTDTLSWHAISSGEKLGEISLRDCTLRRTTTRPRGQGSPGFVLTSRGSSEGEVPLAGAPHRTECHVRMAVDDGAELAELAEFEDWMDALAPFLPRPGVGVSLRFLQRFIAEHPEAAARVVTGSSGAMSSAAVYERYISQGLLATESYVERMLRDPASVSADTDDEMGVGVGVSMSKQPHDVGPSTVFVSHCHESSFGELVATLAQTELRAVKAEQQKFRSYYWIDLFCQPAHTPRAAAKARANEAKERAAVRRAFEEAAAMTGGGAGSLSMDGFRLALQKVGVHHPQSVLRDLLESLDMTGNGTHIELPEFESVVSEYRKTHAVPALHVLAGTAPGAAGGGGGGVSGALQTSGRGGGGGGGGLDVLAIGSSPGEELASRRNCIASAWHPSGVPKLLVLLSEWPTPKSLLHRLGCWHELMLSIELGADMALELSPQARKDFIAQVKSGELSFTLDQRPRWNRPRPGVYSSGPVAQAIDLRTVAAHAKAHATARERERDRTRRPGSSVAPTSSAAQHWLVGAGMRAEEVDWVLHQVEQLPTLTTRGQGGRWVTRGIERLNTAVRNAVEEELYALYQDSVFTGPVTRD